LQDTPPQGRTLAVVLGGLLLTLFLAALDQTIVGTALPHVVADLHGFDHYAWVTTAYLLTSTVSVPIAGKLSDQFGRRPFLLGGAAFFLLASAVCGLVATFGQLVAARALQGVGGGVITAAVFAGVGELFPPAQRSRIVGLFTGTYGLASILGPPLGGVLTDTLGWRWVFYVNVPIGLVALAALWRAYPHTTFAGREPTRPSAGAWVPRRPTVDYLGAAALVGGMTPLLLVLSLGGRELAWGSPLALALVAMSLVGLGLFVLIERRAPEPIIPLDVLRRPTVAAATAGMALLWLAQFGALLFVPLFIQGVLGRSATGSGLTSLPMTLGLVGASVVGGQLVGRFGGHRAVALTGIAIAALGLFLLSTMDADVDNRVLVRDMFLVGAGAGLPIAPMVVAAQSAVPRAFIGVASGLTTFARALGATFGAAIYGALLTSRVGPIEPGAPPADVGALLVPALQQVFLAGVVAAALAFVVVLWLRPGVAEPAGQATEPAADAAHGARALDVA
jgi:EmrB/QacA subfamily drug resistance transporter